MAVRAVQVVCVLAATLLLYGMICITVWQHKGASAVGIIIQYGTH